LLLEIEIPRNGGGAKGKKNSGGAKKPVCKDGELVGAMLRRVLKTPILWPEGRHAFASCQPKEGERRAQNLKQ